jgi:hypothetical protein
VGVEDDGTVSGLDFTDEKLNMLLATPEMRIHKDTPLPSIRAARMIYNGKKTSVLCNTKRGRLYLFDLRWSLSATKR